MKSRSKICIAVIIIFILGIYLLVNSVTFGMALTDGYITKLGHSIEREEFNIILSTYITNVQILGGVISGISGGIIVTLFINYLKRN